MSRNEKMKFVRLIEGSDLRISDSLVKYDMPRSTYYRWKRKLRTQGLQEGRNTLVAARRDEAIYKSGG
ncbi:MAG: hypothetical protein DRI01_09185 [Chloroflexi bacterium]|nr:MAG: hypothetical protein DRI01_09185 [Chloroflexota bacterium]